MAMVEAEQLRVDEELHRFLTEEALPGTGVEPAAFWRGLSDLVHSRADENRRLLAQRAQFQSRIDSWHIEHRHQEHDAAAYRSFLEEIGYLQEEGPDFEIDTTGVDPEINEIAGPQLVVPVTNPRYALNAANARWGSLYDALYGTDAVVAQPPAGGSYDPERGARVVAWVRAFLDDVLPLERGSHADVTSYRAVHGRLEVDTGAGEMSGLQDSGAFAGYRGSPDSPSSVLLVNHGLHIELVLDRTGPVGAADAAGIADVLIESAPTTIVDFEDSVAAVDATDKVAAYRVWLGLMRGDLEATFQKAGGPMTRRLADDREFVAPDGSRLVLRGRALLLVRNVGHFMTTDAVLDRSGRPVPEGLLDAMVTVLIALHDINRGADRRNSRHGSVYVVKPKMHGPDEVAFADGVFAQVEEALGLAQGTVKLGLMDEERRTTLNLKACIGAARSRIAFINTGFLDRTCDEIDTSMQAGPMVRKAEMKSQPWLIAYEDNNVDVGLACGLRGRAQIGKGMWAAPDLMAQMLREKIGQPLAGANCAWVPSPTAATLHATHYHRVDVAEQQEQLLGKRRASIADLLALPLQSGSALSAEEVRSELDNNAQGILGYAVRWVEQGIGCSKVPDIHDVALMEDRATCRISSQHIANWLLHGILDRETVLDALRRMAEVVDGQNAGDAAYTDMAPGFDGVAFRAACELVLLGAEQPSGYTEPILHSSRLEYKQGAGTSPV
ncbi:MAG: malate synthase [Acidimicrobiaceae bacterium]|nr:malate synthase [Acidimicrobiaceae bacterium]